MEFNIGDKCWFVIGHGIAKGDVLDKQRTWQYNNFPITYTIKRWFTTSDSERHYVNENEIFHTKKEAIDYIRKHFNCINIINYSK